MKSPVSVTLIILSIVLLTSAYHFRWKNEQWKYAVHTDAYSYNRYLPMIFIFQEFDDDKDNPDVIKYFIGTALFYAPFFFLACAGSFIFGLPVDGYSMLFPVFTSIGTIFYLIVGLYFLSKFLAYYFARSWIICTLLCTIAFGTMAFFYTVNAPGWAHIVAFSVVCFLLYHLKKILVDFNKGSIVAILVSSSLLFFIRPSDIIILVIAPFLANDFKTFLVFLKKVFSEKKTLLLGGILALIPLICQLSIYKGYRDEFFVWSYTKEKFDFLHPEVIKVLFGYEKGLFIYTPICFIALLGLIRLFKINRFLFTGIILYSLLNIYIISSWWCWNYGCIYGPRVFIEHYPLFFLLLGFLLDSLNRLLKTALIACIVLLSMLNLFQTYQAVIGVLDHDFRTTSAGYWDVFLRTDRGNSGKFYKIPLDESKENVVSRTRLFNDMERADSMWLNPHTLVNEKSYSGKQSSKVNHINNFSVGIRKKMSELPYNKDVLVRVSAWFYIPEKGSNSYLAMSFVSGGRCYRFQPTGLDGFMQHYGEWEHHVFETYMPKLKEEAEKDKGKQIEFYYFNNSQMDCYIDDLSIEFIQFKKMERVLDLSWE